MNVKAKRIIEEKLNSLSKSKFRSSFHLRNKELNYLEKIGIERITEHAYDFINNKLAPLL